MLLHLWTVDLRPTNPDIVPNEKEQSYFLSDIRLVSHRGFCFYPRACQRLGIFDENVSVGSLLQVGDAAGIDFPDH